jgi:predicted Zn-dependent protease with MMP-like domain
MVAVSVEPVHEMVEEALLQLPDDFAREMENVAILVEDRADDRPHFGLYQGIPLTQRGPASYGGVLPDRITIYQESISEYCSDER